MRIALKFRIKQRYENNIFNKITEQQNAKPSVNEKLL